MNNHPGIYDHGGYWQARQVNPPDTQPHIRDSKGKPIKVWIRATGIAVADDPRGDKAYAIAGPWIQEWRERIATARQTMRDTGDAEVVRLADELKAERLASGEETTERESSLIYWAVRRMFERYGNLTPDAQRLAIAAGRARTALSGGRAGEMVNRIIGTAPATATGFLDPLSAWEQSTHRTGDTKKGTKADIEEFATDHPGVTLETLTGKMVSDWFDGLREEGKKPSTIRKKKDSLLHYWKWLTEKDYVSEDHKPFAKRIVDGRNGLQKKADRKLAFKPQDISRIWAKASADTVLADLIHTAARTGIRLEGLAVLCTDETKSLKQRAIAAKMAGKPEEAMPHAWLETDKATGIRFIRLAEKSEAGCRDIPLHPESVPVIDRLAAAAGEDGFLFKSRFNTSGKRGDILGKRFGVLKTEMGFGRNHSFHCIRHTVASMLSAAGVAPKVYKDIIGHEQEGITEKVYIEPAPLADKLAAIKLLQYPAP